MRRVIYFQQILRYRGKNIKTNKFMKAQEQHPKSNDWFIQISRDAIEIEINMSRTEVEEIMFNIWKRRRRNKML